jgi:hypothetical protein
MKLTALHLLLTYRCTYECDHCFVWGSPWQRGTMTQAEIGRILTQAGQVETITGIYFEGGEPFLYYGTLLAGVRRAADAGFTTGIVSNAYWATSVADALAALRPFAGMLGSLSISDDAYHGDEYLARNALAAAQELGIPSSILSVAQPGEEGGDASPIMYRGRAAERLAAHAPHRPWREMDACPYENLRTPSRLHVDFLGNLHICQGITAGNLFETPLPEICARYDPEAHPIVGPLLAGGPAALAQRYACAHGQAYADACQLCYETCRSLREQMPEVLRPDQVYGVGEIHPEAGGGAKR